MISPKDYEEEYENAFDLLERYEKGFEICKQIRSLTNDQLHIFYLLISKEDSRRRQIECVRKMYKK